MYLNRISSFKGLCLPSRLDTLCLFFCRIGVAGLARRAPGTWGSLVAAVLAPVWFLPLDMYGRAVMLGVIFWVGSLAATRAEQILGCKDPSQVVIDELLGVWVSLLPFTVVSVSMLCLSFVLFRFFDILKPWPVRASERWMRDGWGVMLDDAVAGVMTMLCLALLRAAGWI